MTRVVLVTGANRGIGRELARQLALRGDSVVLAAPIATVLSTRARGSAIT